MIEIMKNADYNNMVVKHGEYLTVQELAKELKESTNTVRVRLQRARIKPLSRDALYEKSVLETLKKTPPKGRPKKPPEPEVNLKTAPAKSRPKKSEK
jgi:hypothetical protein